MDPPAESAICIAASGLLLWNGFLHTVGNGAPLLQKWLHNGQFITIKPKCLASNAGHKCMWEWSEYYFRDLSDFIGKWFHVVALTQKTMGLSVLFLSAALGGKQMSEWMPLLGRFSVWHCHSLVGLNTGLGHLPYNPNNQLVGSCV